MSFLHIDLTQMGLILHRQGPLSQTWINLITACIRNYIHYEMWDGISYSCPNFNGAIVEVWEWVSNFIPHFSGHVITYLCWD